MPGNPRKQVTTMDEFDFDEVIDRRGRSTYKYGKCPEVFGSDDPDLLPLWVADMDFRTPKPVADCLRGLCDHGVFGYTIPPASYYEAIQGWLERLHGWRVPVSSIAFSPGVITGFAGAIDALTRPDDKILINEPVYPPFHAVPERLGRAVTVNPLRLHGERYEIDFDLLDHQLADGVKAYLLCNPHNPGGRCWTRGELTRIAELCERHGVLLLSDEIHADMVLWGGEHTPMASVSPWAALHTVTFMAPSKVFNMPGLLSAFYVCESKEMKSALDAWMLRYHLSGGNTLAYLAAETAYRQCGAWREAMLRYVEGNLRYLERAFTEAGVPIHPVLPDASFLVWLDCRSLNLKGRSLRDFFIGDAKVALNIGTTFGQGGKGFMRLNAATPRANLEEAVRRVAAAYKRL